ncbi:MAG: bifunctional D-glycero-beta-D-manno-heptose-7-phosphate kinase/D-glycero-beta-D-manno-heptose 1-phosphate adenylyltransferase HldE [Cardiobacteriaceae bacterium]|nr:bifunctional D-glycero-beta-D-manno-heptose-7-phosphate kinase/D-glycero-beta-D-manno-heptose 1-phosphate adenylyltransferase HldE [Cardiobacteriaceae bacterium]
MFQNDKFSGFSSAKILVVGDAMLDRAWSGQTKRISPEAPVPVVNIQDEKFSAGGAANVAVNITALGAKSALIGLCGEDEAAKILKSEIQKAQITDFLCSSPLPTITKLRIFSRNQQLIRLDFEDTNSSEYCNLIRKKLEEEIDKFETVIFSDYKKGALNEIPELIKIAKNAGKRVLVDPKSDDFSLYRNADLLTPNRGELAAAIGEFDDATILEKTRKCLLDNQIGAILVTLSEQGMRYISADLDIHLPTRAREVFDVTGAGDTVIAALAIALTANYSISEALEIANAAAGIVVGKLGTATANILELIVALEPERARSHGVVSKEELAENLKRARAAGQKIVMTNGCFDILHRGHITYLQEAKHLGDRLVVAVNTDASVKRLKGESRPANSLESRSQVLAALQSVDWVIAFNEDTPEKLIEFVRPDILVKGGDNNPDTIVGGKFVQSYGGKVLALSYVDGFSTTKTLSKYEAGK